MVVVVVVVIVVAAVIAVVIAVVIVIVVTATVSVVGAVVVAIVSAVVAVIMAMVSAPALVMVTILGMDMAVRNVTKSVMIPPRLFPVARMVRKERVDTTVVLVDTAALVAMVGLVRKEAREEQESTMADLDSKIVKSFVTKSTNLRVIQVLTASTTVVHTNHNQNRIET